MFGWLVCGAFIVEFRRNTINSIPVGPYDLNRVGSIHLISGIVIVMTKCTLHSLIVALHLPCNVLIVYYRAHCGTADIGVTCQCH